MKPKTATAPLFRVVNPSSPADSESLAPSQEMRSRYPYLGAAVLRWVEWTPEMAADALAKHNAGNRPITSANLSKLVRQVNDQAFGLSPDCIALAASGRIVNGQHRLTMIRDTGKAQAIPTMYGVDEAMFYLADDGRKRTNGERRATLHPDDEFDHKDWAAVATQLWYLAGHTSGAPSYAELEAIHHVDAASMEWALGALAHKKFITAATVAAFVYAHPVNPSKVEDFAARFVTGANIPEGSGVLYLKNTLDKIAAQRGKRTGIVGLRGLPMLRLALKCIQAWILDRRVMLIRTAESDIACKWFQDQRATAGLAF